MIDDNDTGTEIAAEVNEIKKEDLEHNTTRTISNRISELKDAAVAAAADDNNDNNDRRHLLKWTTIDNHTYYFHQNPMRYCVIFLLILRGAERGIAYGYIFINLGFLTGFYNPNWNPGFGMSKASSFQSSSLAISNLAPFIVAIVADGFLGDFRTLLVALVCFLIPGVALIGLTAYPDLLGSTFNLTTLRVGMLWLYPIGAGAADVCTDVLGGKQFHPLLQQDNLQSYFIWSTVVSGIGGIFGELVIGIVANVNFVASQVIMMMTVTIATVIFVVFSKRYVKLAKDPKKVAATVTTVFDASACCNVQQPVDNNDNNGSNSRSKNKIVLSLPGFEKTKQSNGGRIDDTFVDSFKRLVWVLPIQALLLPVNIGNSQFAGLSIQQSRAMAFPQLWTGSQMIFANSSSVVLICIVLNKYFYPYLKRRNIIFSTPNRLIVASLFNALMMGAMALVDLRIRQVYKSTGDEISIGWQCFPLAIGAFGWSFLMPTQDELTFRIAPVELKTMGNAFNKFVQGSLPNIIAALLYKKLQLWFLTDDGNGDLNSVENYVQASNWKFQLLMGALSLGNALLLAIPSIHRGIRRLEAWAIEKADE